MLKRQRTQALIGKLRALAPPAAAQTDTSRS